MIDYITASIGADLARVFLLGLFLGLVFGGVIGWVVS
jgi:hypothetical protein